MGKKLNIIADANIPGLTELLADIAEITYLPGRSIKATDLAHADALLVRSITQVDKTLLAGSPLSFVGSCTIGTDHVDMDFLALNNITFANAPGCNADAVVDYVLTAMLSIQSDMEYWKQKTVGIVGLGEVGGRLQKRLQRIGIQTKSYDPYKTDAGDDFEQILTCDVVTLHVPLTKTGEHKTWHLISKNELNKLQEGSLLINTSRGAVIDNTALLDYLACHQLNVILDVYEHEPVPAVALLEAVNIATSHIAGYSLQGKIRGSVQVVSALYKHFSINYTVPDLLSGLTKTIKLEQGADIENLITLAYDIVNDSHSFIEKYRSQENDADRSQAFDDYRKNYPVRYEWSYIAVNEESIDRDFVSALGFGKK